MALKKYFLSVDLVIDGKPVTVSLAEFDLMALEKYTSFCNNPDDLLMYMPNDEPFFVKNYLSTYIKRPITIDDDPFSIRTSKSKRAKVMDKLTILTNHLQLLAELAADLQEQIASAQDGAKEKSLNQIMGSLYGLSTTAEHIKNIYETMVLVHRK